MRAPKLLVLAALVVTALFAVTGAAFATATANTGAIWTTTVSCGDVDINVDYASKQDVYLNGGGNGQNNGLADGYVRPIAWRGSEQLAVSAQNTKIHLAIAAWAWPSYFGPDRMKGIRLSMAEWRRPDPRTAPTASKAAGLYVIGTLSKHAAEAAGCNDALMLDWRGQVAEATGANIFFVLDGKLHTPTPDCFLDGITRRSVMSLARHRQITVLERAIMPEEMPKASEAFLAGTAAEVTPIRQIGDYAFEPGPITEALLTDYEALVRMSPEEVAKRVA